MIAVELQAHGRTSDRNTDLSFEQDAGGTEPNEMRDYGFMQQRTIEDFDGHTWEIFYMDITKFPKE